MFPHRSIHKYTWTSPDGKTLNSIIIIGIWVWRPWRPQSAIYQSCLQTLYLKHVWNKWQCVL
jgi:hypothetical protein